jgi:hypothetical protein
MTSVNWGKVIRRIVITLALALTLSGPFIPAPPQLPANTPVPLVNWNS